jgi:zinc protease
MRHSHFDQARGLSMFRPGSVLRTAAFLTCLSVAASAQAQAPQPAPRPQPPAPAAAPARQGAGAATALPSARSIIDRYVEAIGGRKAVLGHSSTHASGTMSMPSSGVSGGVEVYAARPNKSFIKLTLGGIGEVLEGFDGTVGWSLSAITGPMLTLGKELEQKKFDAAYDADLHEPGRYKAMQTVEKTTFEGRPCYKVSLTHMDGTEDLEYYDVETRFKVGTVATRDSSMGAVQVTQLYADYKKFGDLMVPTTMKQSTMGVQQVLTFTVVEFDTVQPSVFEPPPAIKAMLK